MPARRRTDSLAARPGRALGANAVKRNEHLFQFTGEELAKASKAEATYHFGRAIWWKAEQELAAKKARETGVEVREVEVSGGTEMQIVLDGTLQSRLTLCQWKIREHRKAADEFQIHAATYASNPSRSYELQPDDVIYFRLAGSPRPK